MKEDPRNKNSGSSRSTVHTTDLLHPDPAPLGDGREGQRALVRGRGEDEVHEGEEDDLLLVLLFWCMCVCVCVLCVKSVGR